VPDFTVVVKEFPTELAGLPCVALPATEARSAGIEDLDSDRGGRVIVRIAPREWAMW
jgi:hypothetical protein